MGLVNISEAAKKFLQNASGISLMLVLSSCSESYVDTVSVEPTVGLTTPKMFSGRMIVEDNLRPDVTIGDSPVEVQRSGTRWLGSFLLPEGSSETLRVVWFENVNSIDLPLAESETLVTASNSTISIDEY